MSNLVLSLEPIIISIISSTKLSIDLYEFVSTSISSFDFETNKLISNILTFKDTLSSIGLISIKIFSANNSLFNNLLIDSLLINI